MKSTLIGYLVSFLLASLLATVLLFANSVWVEPSITFKSFLSRLNLESILLGFGCGLTILLVAKIVTRPRVDAETGRRLKYISLDSSELRGKFLIGMLIGHDYEAKDELPIVVIYFFKWVILLGPMFDEEAK